jgi:hypothetical protein
VRVFISLIQLLFVRSAILSVMFVLRIAASALKIAAAAAVEEGGKK